MEALDTRTQTHIETVREEIDHGRHVEAAAGIALPLHQVGGIAEVEVTHQEQQLIAHLIAEALVDIFEVLDHQDDLQTKYTGGTTIHIFAGERISNNETMKNLVRKICSNYRLPYFTFSPTFSICPNHGYVVGEHFTCPECGEDCEVYSRIVGYIRPVQQWNKGKQAEFKTRKTYVVEEKTCKVC